MRSHGKTLLLTGGILLLIATLAGFGAYPMHAEDRAQWLTDKISHELDLRSDQIARLDTVKRRVLEAHTRMRQEHAQHSEQIQTLLAAPTLDQDRLLTMLRQTTTEVNDLAPDVIAALADFYASLDDQQRQTLREHIAERMQHHDRRHHW